MVSQICFFNMPGAFLKYSELETVPCHKLHLFQKSLEMYSPNLPFSAYDRLPVRFDNPVWTVK